MQQAWSEDKLAVFHEGFVSQQADLERCSKFYWQPKKRMKQWHTLSLLDHFDYYQF